MLKGVTIMNKCDVIIPVYNAPEWIKLCIYAVLKNTNDRILNKIIIADDCSDQHTKELLHNIKNRYTEKIEIITNTDNLGFVKNCNNALKQTKANYVLLLNSDCIIAENTIEKLIKHIENDNKIGLICPISSNAANLTLPMFDGFNYCQMNTMLEQNFSGISFDACTVTGNCLMITRECIEKVGLLDETYGTGYGEETDYQFKAMQNGFKAKVAIDVYAYHKAEASFGILESKQEKINHNRKIFFGRWGKDYYKLLEKYEKNDPIKYVYEHLKQKDKKINAEALFYLPNIAQDIGGAHNVIDIVNLLNINGVSTNIIYNSMGKYDEPMLFAPISICDVEQVKTKKLISTLYNTVFPLKKIALKLHIPLISFIQGYEVLFCNGSDYASAELSYKMADHLLCISDYLRNEIYTNFHRQSTVILNGINYDMLNNERRTPAKKVVLIVLRDNVMKGDWILLDVIKKITESVNNIELRIIYQNKNIQFPENNNSTIMIKKYLGPLNRTDIASLLKESDVFIDASLNEGFGLMGLEAMAAHCAVIAGNSLGNKTYLRDGDNGILITEVNDSSMYVKKLKMLLSDQKMLDSMKCHASQTAVNYDLETRIIDYKNYFLSATQITTENVTYSENERKLMNKIEENMRQDNDTIVHNKKNKMLIRKIAAKTLPVSVKHRLRMFLEKLID